MYRRHVRVAGVAREDLLGVGLGRPTQQQAFGFDLLGEGHGHSRFRRAQPLGSLEERVIDRAVREASQNFAPGLPACCDLATRICGVRRGQLGWEIRASHSSLLRPLSRRALPCAPSSLALRARTCRRRVSTANPPRRKVEADQAEIAAARRELAAAKIEARLYWQVEYPVSDARARRGDPTSPTRKSARCDAQLRRYGPFHAFAYGQQPTLDYRNVRLCLAEAEAAPPRS